MTVARPAIDAQPLFLEYHLQTTPPPALVFASLSSPQIGGEGLPTAAHPSLFDLPALEARPDRPRPLPTGLRGVSNPIGTVAARPLSALGLGVRPSGVGLSYTSYLPALFAGGDAPNSVALLTSATAPARSASTRILALRVRPGRVSYTLRDWASLAGVGHTADPDFSTVKERPDLSEDAPSPTKFARKPAGGRRARIKEFTPESRGRLCALTHDLEAMGLSASGMITLTAPGVGVWEHVYLRDALDPDTGAERLTGGRLFKAHLRDFQKRLERWAKKEHLKIKALWYLEFQKRGAPHVHIELLDFPEDRLEQLRPKVAVWWADIVAEELPAGFQDAKGRNAYAMHLSAGTRTEEKIHKDLRYTRAYAVGKKEKKKFQKDVPEDFRDVGRFYGLWGVKVEEQTVIIEAADTPDATALISTLVKSPLGVVAEYPTKSPEKLARFVRRVHEKYSGDTLAEFPTYFGHHVAGKDATRAVLDVLELIRR